MISRMDNYSKNNKLIFILIASAVIGQGVAYKSIYLFHIVSLLFVGDFIITNKLQKGLEAIKSYLPLLAILTVPFLSLMWTDEIGKAELVYLYGISTIAASFILSSIGMKLSPRTTLLSLGAITFISLVIGYGESMGLIRYPLSVYSNLNWIAGRDYTYTKYNTIPTGFAWNPNDFATFLCAVLPILYGTTKRKVQKWGSVIAIFLLIILSNSRTAMIISSVELLAIFTMELMSLKISKLRKLLFLIIVVVGFTTIAVTIISLSRYNTAKFKILLSKAEIIATPSKWNNLPDDSENRRFTWIYNLGTAISKQPLIGYGVNKATSPELHPNAKNEVSPHAFPLELITNFGIPWFLAVLFLYLRLLANLFRKEGGQGFLISLIFLPVCSLSMSSCIFATPLFCLIGIAHGWSSTPRAAESKSVQV